MARSPLDDDALASLVDMVDPPEPPPPKKRKKGEDTWHPKLGPAQLEVFNSKARYVLADGEKGSGKTVGCLHKLARHCWENDNALAVILVRVRAMATKGGAWDKLTTMILPEWKRGLGVEYTDVKYDSQHNEFLWIQNRFGGWSMAVLISAPHAHQLRERIRGYEPSLVFVDELTSCDDIEYLRAPAAQVGRRAGITGVQQYIAACNPEGPSHWVHAVWFVEAYDEELGEWDSDYHRVHVPIAENKANLPEGYIENLEKLYKNDPIEADRMLRGVWVDRPSGEAIFKEVWNPIIHVRPAPNSTERIKPTAGYPIVIGLDPGAVYNAFIFMQYLPIGEEMTWVVFDEVVYIKRRIKYDVLFPVVLRRLKWWLARFSEPPPAVWISDSSAFNQFRPGSGSFDCLELEKIAERVCPSIGLEKVKIKPAPKFSGSVPARVRLVMDLLGSSRLLVSSGCTHLIEMFRLLESEPQKPGGFDPDLALTPRRSDYIHAFDALTYPIITQAIAPTTLAPAPKATGTFKS